MMRSERLTYEPLGGHHAPLLFEALSDPRVWRYIDGNDGETVEAMAASFAHRAAGPALAALAGQIWLNFAVYAVEEAACIGRIEATVLPEGWAEVGFVLGPAYWGRGYAKESLRWLLTRIPCSEIWATAHPENAGSRAVLQAVGFEQRPSGQRRLLSEDPGDVVYILESSTSRM